MYVRKGSSGWLYFGGRAESENGAPESAEFGRKADGEWRRDGIRFSRGGTPMGVGLMSTSKETVEERIEDGSRKKVEEGWAGLGVADCGTPSGSTGGKWNSALEGGCAAGWASFRGGTEKAPEVA